jgi:hypothetical protein
VSDVHAEKSTRHRGGVAIANDRVGFEAFAIDRIDAADPTAADKDARDIAAICESDAAVAREIGERGGKTIHSALDGPYAGLLDMSDQHQGRGGQKRRRSAIGGVAAEQLPQPGIAKVLAEGVPKGCERRYSPQVGEAGGPDSGRERNWVWTRTAQERILQRIVNGGRATAKITKSASFRSSRERRDSLRALIDVGEKIERFRFAPNMSGQRAQRAQFDMISQIGPDLGENFIKHPAHRQNRGPGIDLGASDLDFPHFTAGRRLAFEHGHGEAARGEQQSANQPSDPRPDDRHAPRSHSFTSDTQRGLIVRMECVNLSRHI